MAIRPGLTRQCAVCGQLFDVKAGNARLCGNDQCRRAWYRDLKRQQRGAAVDKPLPAKRGEPPLVVEPDMLQRAANVACHLLRGGIAQQVTICADGAIYIPCLEEEGQVLNTGSNLDQFVANRLGGRP